MGGWGVWGLRVWGCRSLGFGVEGILGVRGLVLGLRVVLAPEVWERAPVMGTAGLVFLSIPSQGLSSRVAECWTGWLGASRNMRKWT